MNRLIIMLITLVGCTSTQTDSCGGCIKIEHAGQRDAWYPTIVIKSDSTHCDLSVYDGDSLSSLDFVVSKEVYKEIESYVLENEMPKPTAEASTWSAYRISYSSCNELKQYYIYDSAACKAYFNGMAEKLPDASTNLQGLLMDYESF